MDLGMSSLQLDDPNRGFSFKSTGELDMRFDTSDENCLTAFKVINFASELEITEIFSKFGEEKDAQVAAGMICKYRNEQKITNPAQLAKVLNYAFFTSKAVNKYDCITRCFQALRIFVNRELDNVQTLIKLAFNQLGPGGVLLVISFHSLEDILVLKAMKEHVITTLDRKRKRRS
jgi:16S rRNA (cytosine1402-N4)-methyltransferase